MLYKDSPKKRDDQIVLVIPLEKWRAHKPVSVIISAIYLTQPTPWHRAGSPHLPVYLALQAFGPCSRGHRCPGPWALTPRFHPYRPGRRRLFSVTAPARLLLPAISAGRCPALSGLSSPAKPARRTVPPKQISFPACDGAAKIIQIILKTYFDARESAIC